MWELKELLELEWGVIDESQAPHVEPMRVPISYHCPNTTCDGHYYLTPHEMGLERTCPKCGLAATIGGRESTGVPAQIKRPSLSARALPAVRNAVTILALVLVVAMGVYPPWNQVLFRSGRATLYESAYGWILAPPHPTDFDVPRQLWKVEIDLTRLLLQWLSVCVVAAGIHWVLRRRTGIR